MLHHLHQKFHNFLHMPKKTHKLNIMLTEQQFQRLKLYAEQQEESMAEVIRNLIKKLSIKETSNID